MLAFAFIAYFIILADSAKISASIASAFLSHAVGNARNQFIAVFIADHSFFALAVAWFILKNARSRIIIALVELGIGAGAENYGDEKNRR
jgi:hypothetical protein